MRRLVLLMVVGSMLLTVGSAQASPLRVFKGAVKCAPQRDGVRFCGSRIIDGHPAPVRTLATSWDGTAVDVNFALPRASANHHGPYPLVMLFHGYGGSKLGLGNTGGGLGSAISSMQPWLNAGYATFSMSDRGFGESCGTAASRASVPARECAHGYNHLLDTRYEVRDAQYFAGELADEGLVSPTRIAAIGGSYGGGMSMALAALKNRVMLPNGRLVPWRSPEGKRMRIAAAAPFIPWTDLGSALVPNGSTLDYVANAPYRGRYGVMKESYVNALYAVGCNTPTTYCTTTNPNWDLGAWLKRLNQGEPYTGSLVTRILHQTTTYHSSYYIDHSEPPAPLLIANGWTDDLFPADEALRFYNRTKTQYPDAPVSLFFGDWGHPRAQNKAADIARYVTAVDRWLNYYVRGHGHKPFQGVEALTETCPATASSGGPYRASDWAHLSPGEVRLTSARVQTILPNAGSSAIGMAFNPITASACATAPGATQPGSATYRIGVRRGFTMIGSATVIADFTLPSATSQVAARLLDVAPNGIETLVSRGLWRPKVSGKPVRQGFQLHPGGWHFSPGHTVKLELLPNDAPYGRASNGQGTVTASHLQLRLPTVNRPGADGGLVKKPLPKFLPPGYVLAREFAHGL
jgi:X-Pro dipeptidyl-peptidase (S15 family)/X-Pro dipeptidyl-peptidase C-terminal non-catalytic domain